MEFVFDRTEEDVRQGTEKGFYSAKDLNRVERAVKQLQQMAQQQNIQIQLQTKTDWVFPDSFSQDNWPTKTQMDRFLLNVGRLSRACGVYGFLPESMEYLDWFYANRIEETLYQTYQKLQSLAKSNRSGDDTDSGEETI